MEQARRGSTGMADGARRGSQGSIGSGHKENPKILTGGYPNEKHGAKKNSLEKDDHVK